MWWSLKDWFWVIITLEGSGGLEGTDFSLPNHCLKNWKLLSVCVFVCLWTVIQVKVLAELANGQLSWCNWSVSSSLVLASLSSVYTLLMTWLMPVSAYVTYILANFPYWFTLSNLGIWPICGIGGTYLLVTHIWQYQGKIELHFVIFVLICAIMLSLYVLYSRNIVGHTYMDTVETIFFQGHMPIMWNLCIFMFLVTLLIVLISYEVYILT